MNMVEPRQMPSRHPLAPSMLADVLLFASLLAAAKARDDGLARTPPMGWSTWYAFGTDINETKVVQMADALVEHGLRDAGYEFVNLDDAWMAPMRDRFGKLRGDLQRFPSGMKWLADQMHSRGLKLGLYGCPGVRTCEGFPGQFEHEYQDAQTLAQWGVDWWKYDNCWQEWATVEMYSGSTRTGHNSWPSTESAIASMLDSLQYSLNIRGLSQDGQDAHPVNYLNITGLPLPTDGASSSVTNRSPRGRQIQYYEAYRLFGEALQATGRNITYSICPLIAGCDESIWTYYKDHAHLSMNQCPQEDNTDNWQSFIFHIDDNNAFPARADAAGPGYWNDLDFLMVGYKELKDWEDRQTLAEYRSQYSLFAILAAPIIFSADIRGTQNGTYVGHNGVHHSMYNGWTTELETILLNKEVIQVSQDELGKQGSLSTTLHLNPGNCTVELYTRQLSNGALAVAVLNRGDFNVSEVSVKFADVGVPKGKVAKSVRDLWLGAALVASADGFLVEKLASHDTAMFRLEFEAVI
jgi:hypothetical protein